MATSVNGRKIQLPRKLEAIETASSLRLWKVHYVNYTRTDPYFAHFVKAETTWNPNTDDWGFAAEVAEGSLKRSKAEMKSDCLMFLETLSSYLPTDYLMDNVSETGSLKDVWKVVDTFYGTTLSSFTFLELATMSRLKEETYRQFYMRMEGYVAKHLTTGGVKVENVTSPATGDTLTISLKNVIVIMWLSKISPKLVDYVRIEFGTELKAGRQLIELMGPIADNVESILARHDHAGTVTNILEGEETDDFMHNEAAICRTEGFQGRRNRSNGPRPNFSQQNKFTARPQNKPRDKVDKDGKVLHCPKCQYLSEALRLRISTNHEPSECFRRDLQVRQIEADFDTADDLSESEFVGQSNLVTISSPHHVQFQNETSREDVDLDDPGPAVRMLTSNLNSSLSDEDIQDTVLKIQQSHYRSHSGTAQASSPTLLVEFHGHRTTALVDEGANINCLSLKFAKSSNLDIDPTDNTARGADSNSLRVVGKARTKVKLQTVDGGIPIWLKHVTIVDGLSTDIIIGEPGKRDCNILTNATNRTITIPFQNKDYVIPYAKNKVMSSRVARVSASTFIAPGIIYRWRVPKEFHSLSHLHLQPRRQDRAWFRTGVCHIQKGFIHLKNILAEPVTFKRGEVFGEVRLVEILHLDGKVNKVQFTLPDPSQYVSNRDPELAKICHVHKVKLDPDKILSEEQRDEFRKLCEEFSDILRPEPGRYNGSAGHVNNRINFHSRPAPNKIIYQQKLSDTMRKLLGEKMDKLRSFGVLAFPEEVGVIPEFVSPSMLLPKQEAGEWRLVTDLSSLNKFITKPQGRHPTIEDAKKFLAKKKFAIHVDLSNFFFQAGMDRADTQWLATLHPFRGLMVYLCEPMGLNGAPEHSYERLARVFAPLFMENKMVRMADGLHIGCDSVEEGLDSMRQMFLLCRKAGLTLKPEKVEIFPQKVTLFGWELNNGYWSPTQHTTSALSIAPLPKTIKMLRGFLGAFKQFSQCVKGHGPLLSQLEAMTGSHRPSAEMIEWTEEQKKAFNLAREAVKTAEAYSIPRPSDKLFVYSDFSREHRAVGGKLEFERTELGVTRRYLGGHFSQTVDSYKANWWPCEGESLGARLVLEAFKHYILENQGTTTMFTDNKPVVDAWNLARKGGFSSNARVATFLTSVSNLPVEFRHKAGKFMETSDYASRHPMTCPEKSCALCKFAYGEQMVGDNCDLYIREITVEEVLSGKVTMPCTSRKAWLDIQSQDQVHIRLRAMLELGQSPHKKQTKGDNFQLKLLHNLYLKGDLKVETDGLVLVRQHGGDRTGWVISVPHRLFGGLCQALHLRFSHPSKAQLSQIISRHYYSPGFQAVINETVDQCSQCLSLKTLPKVLKEFTTTPLGLVGEKFSSDVMMRAGQKFLVTAEDLSGYALLTEIPDQKAETLGPALLEQVLPFCPDSGAVVRTDGAAPFRSVQLESQKPGSVWARHNIKIELGQALNQNKNPVAEILIKQVEKEFLRHAPGGQQISKEALAVISKSLNTRIKTNGLASREIVMSRSNHDNKYLDLSDKNLAEQKLQARQESSKAALKHNEKRGAKKSPQATFLPGDLVYLRSSGDKTRARELYLVQKLLPTENLAVVRKQQDQLQAKTYKVDISELISNSNYRPGPPSADMSKKEQDRSENKTETEDKMKATTEERNPTILKSLRRENPAAGTSMGAPLVNAAGRPLRRAAHRANQAKAWLNNIVMSHRTKCPWLQEDQYEDDEEADMMTITAEMLRTKTLAHRSRVIEEAATSTLFRELPIDPIGYHNPGSDTPAEVSSEANSQASDLERLSWDYEFQASNSSTSEERSDPVSPLDSDDDLSAVMRALEPVYVGPALNDWLPTRLSSDITNQLEVTHLPTSSGTDERYFLSENVFNSDPEVDNDTTNRADYESKDATPVNSPIPAEDKSHHTSQLDSVLIPLPQRTVEAISPSPGTSETQLGNSTNSATSSASSRKSRIPTRTPPQRSSARLSSKPRTDFHSLHNRGREQPRQ